MKRVGFALALLSLTSLQAGAVGIRLRPQTPQIEQLVTDLLRRLSSSTVPLTLDKTSGPVYVLAAPGAVAFNPDVSARTVTVPGANGATEKRTEFNPQGPVPLKDAVEAEVKKELGLSALTPEAAQLRYSGADLNNDSKIDTADLAILMGNFGQSGGSQRGDLNNDGHIDNLDLKLFSAQYKLP
jgi:hypothetical protein